MGLSTVCEALFGGLQGGSWIVSLLHCRGDHRRLEILQTVRPSVYRLGRLCMIFSVDWEGHFFNFQFEWSEFLLKAVSVN